MVTELEYGYAGKILKVDLTTGNVVVLSTSDYSPRFLGGRLLAARLYWDEVMPEVGPFDPENKIIIATGPATGTAAPATCKWCITTKSPTPYPVPCYYRSFTGGHWGAELKFAGFDGIIIGGRAKKPVYLWIHDGVVEIKDARFLWGTGLSQTASMLRKAHGDRVRVASIGPAGENMLNDSPILFDGTHAAGFGGSGAVMGSKMLKAMVVRGTGGIKVARPQELLDVRQHYSRLLRRKPGEGGPQHRSKDPLGLEATHGFIAPKPDCSKVRDEWFNGCFACPLNCQWSVHSYDEAVPDFSDSCAMPIDHKAFEEKVYGTALGQERMYINAVKNDLGLSTFQGTLHAVRPWLLELVPEGIVTSEDLGLPVEEMGTKEWLTEFYRKLINRDGFFYEKLASGEKFWEWLTERDPRAKKWYDLYYCKHGVGYYHSGQFLSGHVQTSGRQIPIDGPAVVATATDFRWHACKDYDRLPWGNDKLLRKFIGVDSAQARDPEWEGIARLAVYAQNTRFVADSIPYCNWAWPVYTSQYTPDSMGDPSIGVKVLAALTGIERTFDDNARLIGDLGFNLERAILVREGRRRQHDSFNDDFFTHQYWYPYFWEHYNDSLPAWFTKEWLSRKLDSYYDERGWDKETGIPARSTLENIGLKFVADDLESRYGVAVPQ